MLSKRKRGADRSVMSPSQKRRLSTLQSLNLFSQGSEGAAVSDDLLKEALTLRANILSKLSSLELELNAEDLAKMLRDFIDKHYPNDVRFHHDLKSSTDRNYVSGGEIAMLAAVLQIRISIETSTDFNPVFGPRDNADKASSQIPTVELMLDVKGQHYTPKGGSAPGDGLCFFHSVISQLSDKQVQVLRQDEAAVEEGVRQSQLEIDSSTTGELDSILFKIATDSENRKLHFKALSNTLSDMEPVEVVKATKRFLLSFSLSGNKSEIAGCFLDCLYTKETDSTDQSFNKRLESFVHSNISFFAPKDWKLLVLNHPSLKTYFNEKAKSFFLKETERSLNNRTAVEAHSYIETLGGVENLSSTFLPGDFTQEQLQALQKNWPTLANALSVAPGAAPRSVAGGPGFFKSCAAGVKPVDEELQFAAPTVLVS